METIDLTKEAKQEVCIQISNSENDALSGLDKFDFWSSEFKVKEESYCLSCTNGGTGDCAACRE